MPVACPSLIVLALGAMRTLLLLPLLILAFLAPLEPALGQERRVALVIGNAAYQHNKPGPVQA